MIVCLQALPFWCLDAKGGESDLRGFAVLFALFSIPLSNLLLVALFLYELPKVMLVIHYVDYCNMLWNFGYVIVRISPGYRRHLQAI